MPTRLLRSVRPMQKRLRLRFIGEGLDGLMYARSNDLSGIVNGLDYNEYCPFMDPDDQKALYVRYVPAK